ncbi:MAG: 2-oxoacid:acceptor oxidoreductase subunit alpha [Anaerolineaceae bacterium]
MIQNPVIKPHRETGVDLKIVNDFCITMSTINGSGSATANLTLLRTLFRMGIPVSGKNIFPSNIQGQPTWYTIRLNNDGYLARLEKDDIVVAMNPASFAREESFLVPGGVLFYDEDISQLITRKDIHVYPMPVKRIVKESEAPTGIRDFLANMVYVGVLAQILGIDIEKIHKAIDFQFKGKKSASDINFGIVKKAAEWAAENLVKIDRYYVQPMPELLDYIMADGNTAAALGAVYGGVQFTAWYPITPATSLTESLMEYLPIMRKDPDTGKETFVIVQAEDELAAIGMTAGAGWAGLRSMTSTSGPGFSLMQEYLSLAYFAEIPLVVWDVQRVGPSTGLPTRTAQSDITQAYFTGHGDTQFVLLFPGSVNECFEFGWRALDISERLQGPVLVLSDLDLGMNTWMTKKFEYPAKPMDRGKILWEDDLKKMLEERRGDWGRYLDIDGDGIPYRTVPGNKLPGSAYFGRGTGHDEFSQYTEDGEVWERVFARIATKYETIKNYLPEPVIQMESGARNGIIACGSTDMAVEEALHLFKVEGKAVDYLRLRAFPLTNDVVDFINQHEKIYVVEINRDGQLKQLLTINVPEAGGKFVQVSKMDGLPLTARWIKTEISKHEETQK